MWNTKQKGKGLPNAFLSETIKEIGTDPPKLMFSFGLNSKTTLHKRSETNHPPPYLNVVLKGTVLIFQFFGKIVYQQ